MKASLHYAENSCARMYRHRTQVYAINMTSKMNNNQYQIKKNTGVNWGVKVRE